MREIARYCRRNLFFAYMTDGADRPDHRPEWTQPSPETHVIADRNRPATVSAEAARFLAVTAAVYLLVVFAIGIF